MYRHSVVPGGVADAAELAQIIRTDKVVAQHYAEFDLERAQPVTVSTARSVYISYRKGDQIYWTARKIMLRPGETLLSDGRNETRTRCANRISDVPRLPVEPDAPNPESLEVLVFDGFGGEAIVMPGVRVPKLAPPRFPGRPVARSPWPPLDGIGRPAVPPRYGHPPEIQLLASITPPPLSGAVTVEPPGPAMPPPPQELPEPASAWLMAVAMAALVARRRQR